MKKLTVIISLVVLAFNLNAQIVYTNMGNEMSAIYLDGCGINLTESAMINFYVFPIPENYTSDSDSVIFISYLTNCHFVRKPGVGDANPLEWGDSINANSTWQWLSEWETSRVTLASAQGSDYSGLCINADSKFLGFRYFINGDTIYGWVRLSLNMTSKTIKVHDYAINSAPNQGIAAGELEQQLTGKRITAR